MIRVSRALALALALAGTALSGCRSADPRCTGTAADHAPSPEAFRAMSPEQRRDDAARFNALARTCGWEP